MVSSERVQIKMSKRITSIIIAVLVAVSAIGVTAGNTSVVSANTDSEGNYEYIMTVDRMADQAFDGNAVCPVPTVRVNGIVLEESQYQIVSYVDNTSPGYGMVTVELVFNDSLYRLLGIDSTADMNEVKSRFNTITESAEFKILQPEPEEVEKEKTFVIYGVKKTYQYEGAPVEPPITVKDGEKVLTEGVDYTVKYDELTDLNMSIRVMATGIGEYEGFYAEKWYYVTFKYGVHMYRSYLLEKCVYTGKPIVPKVEVLGNFTDNNGYNLKDPYPLEYGVDFTIVAANNVNAGSKAQYWVKGMGYFMGTEPDPNYFTIEKRNVKNLKVTGITDKVYTGKAIKQDKINMYLGDIKMVRGKEYTVTYENNVKCGKATIIIKGIGRNFKGKKVMTFNIYPRKVNNVNLMSGDDSVTVKYNKNYGGVTGYQVRYAANEKFSGYKAKNTTGTSVKISSLGDKQEYYVKVRAYKSINGKKVFGNWSDVKKIKTR